MRARLQPKVNIINGEEVVTSDAAIVRLTLWIDNEEIIVDGTAKRMPGDKPNEDIALLLAYSRAIQKVSKTLETRSNGLIKHYDDLAIMRPLQKKKNEARLKKTTKKRPAKRVRSSVKK